MREGGGPSLPLILRRVAQAVEAFGLNLIDNEFHAAFLEGRRDGLRKKQDLLHQ